MNLKFLSVLVMFFVLLLSSSAYALETNYTISTGASCGGSDENGDCTIMTDQDNATGWYFDSSLETIITFYFINMNATSSGTNTHPMLILYSTQLDSGVNFFTSCYNFTTSLWGSTIENYTSSASQDQIEYPESCIQADEGTWKIYMRITIGNAGGTYFLNDSYLRYTLTEEEEPPAIPLVLQVNSISPDNDTATTGHYPTFAYIANSTNATTLNTEVFIDYLNGTTSSIGSNATTLNGTVTELIAQYPLLFHGQLDWWVNVTQDDVSNVSERRRLTVNDVPLVLQASLISPANDTTTTHHVPIFTYIANSSNSSILSVEIFADLLNGTVLSVGQNTTTLNATATELIANYPLLFHQPFDWWVNVTQGSVTNKSNVRRMTIAPIVAEIIYPVNGTSTYDTTPTAILRVVDGGNLSGWLYFINATDAYLVGSNTSMINNTLTNITANFTLALGTYTVQFNATRINGTVETDSVIFTILGIPAPPVPTMQNKALDLGVIAISALIIYILMLVMLDKIGVKVDFMSKSLWIVNLIIAFVFILIILTAL
jgi:hypothetical protein